MDIVAILQEAGPWLGLTGVILWFYRQDFLRHEKESEARAEIEADRVDKIVVALQENSRVIAGVTQAVEGLTTFNDLKKDISVQLKRLEMASGKKRKNS